jgi:hypothetical protein
MRREDKIRVATGIYQAGADTEIHELMIDQTIEFEDIKFCNSKGRQYGRVIGA